MCQLFADGWYVFENILLCLQKAGVLIWHMCLREEGGGGAAVAQTDPCPNHKKTYPDKRKLL